MRTTGDDEAVFVLFKSDGILHNISSVRAKHGYIVEEISKLGTEISIGRTFRGGIQSS